MTRNFILDNIRGIAIILVVISHFYVNKDYMGVELLGSYFPQIEFISNLGLIGVDLFFFLSGYLIYNKIQEQNFKEFIIKRIFRIYPIYIFTILLIFIFSININNLILYLINLSMLQDIFHVKNLNPVFWTLLIEIKFYIIIAVIFMLLKKLQLVEYFIYIPFVFIFLNIFLILTIDRGSILLAYFPMFFIVVYLLKLNIKLSIILIISELINIYLTYHSYYVELFIAVLLFIIIYYKNILNFDFLKVLAKVSYSYYLIHTIIGYYMLHLLLQFISNVYVVFFIIIPFVSISIFYLSYILYSFIEKPFINYGYRLTKRLK
jgi:peptidoglycan/LPS O-acetylase OafA/YrhL